MQNYTSSAPGTVRALVDADRERIPHFMPKPVPSPAPIPLSRPALGALERQYVNEVLHSHRLALGPYLTAFERRMAEACGTRHAVAVSSGTAALHLIVRSLGLGPGDEVLTTPFSFIASANAALYEGAHVRFVDIDPTTYALDTTRLAEAVTPATRAVLAVDVFGLPADWPALTALADQHDLHLIDDACEALGARIAGRPIGAWGTAAAFGFYPNKQVTLGEGGCITTDDDALAARCRSLRNQGRADDARMEHVDLGYNYRLDELSAALGCAQLERLGVLLDRRATVAAWYAEDLADLAEDLTLPPVPTDRTRSWFVYVVRLADHFPPDARDVLMEHLRADGIGCAPYFPCIHLQPYYRRRFGYRPGAFPVAEHTAARTLALPFYPDLPREAVRRVARSLTSGLSTLHSPTSLP